MGAALRRIQLGNALSAFGNGFTVPFLFIYVSQVRDLGASTAGIVLATFAVAALVVLPFTGRVIDRRGPLPVAIAGTVSAAVGSMGLGLADSQSLVVAAAAALGAGIAVIQPSLATMIVWCSTPSTRSHAFATQFFLNNLGLGVGGLLGGQLVDTSDPSSFVRLFAIESVMFLVLGAAIATVRLPKAPKVEDAVPTDGAKGGWRTLLADRAMVQLCVLGFVMFFACYGQFESGLAAFAVEVTRISPATLGIALAANTAAIVLAQFVVLKLVERRRRSRVIALVGLIWTVAWVAAGVSGLVPGAHGVATALLISTYALFGIGESMLAPTMAPLVADLAPARLVGQYNSAFALVKQLALAVGPAVGGLMAGGGMYVAYIVMLVVCSLGISGLALRMGRRLTPAQEIPPRMSAVRAKGGVVRAGGKEAEPTGPVEGTERTKVSV
ncbi:MFS transporter [Streptomyces albireticuli]|uniref:MFS transporter n=1 Tax=Streptomyces albireticuli TaxID=1940 RepID=UPI001E3E969D|nr:MFS transporter [Streptomyces albireticuli]MCD9145967.1 MFS transporter [Streptomyces albireticuli]MCD9166160.1 MFS transporter [Streptomyces albireticuli]MCD9196456.1 MFS transporter [Streptomyces albireticuli]